MKRKIVAFVLLFTIIMGNTIGFAAKGDIIHTGLKKIYKAGNSTDMDELVNDILNGANTKKFYREVDDGKYINIVEEESKQIERLGEIFSREGITTPEDMERYVVDNSEDIEKELQEAIKGLEVDFENIDEGSIEDYKGASHALILDSNHYSTPVPGSKEGTTRIDTLNLPSGGSKWMIQVLDKKVEPMDKDTLLVDGTSYAGGRDIEIEVGQYLVLYAVDRNNRIKGYGNIEIVEGMVGEGAYWIEVDAIGKGKKWAGAIVIDELDGRLPEGADKWQFVVRDTSVDKVYKDETIDGARDYNVGEDIVVATEGEIHSISDEFKKYILLLATDDKGQVKGYSVLEIGKDNISLPPIRLEERVHFEGPVAGDKDGTTKFTELDLDGAVEWKAVVSSSRINVPVMDSIPDKGTVNLSENQSFQASVGDFVLLMAVDGEGKIKGYRIFKLDESQVKGKTAHGLPKGSYSDPVKGSAAGTTKIETLHLDGVEGASKWMYKVGQNLADSVLDKVVEGSRNYTAGQDIKASIEDTLLILATDDEGRVKAFGRIELDGDMIKDPLATELIETTHYTKPVKGDGVGSTKIGFLQFYKATSWKYTMNEDEIDIPEMNSEVLEAEDITMEGNSTEDIKIFDETSSELKADEGFKRNMIIYAIKDNKVIAYKKFELDNSNVKLPEAEKLTLQNYDKPIKGNNPNSTRITKLEHIGLADTEKFMYKFIDEDMILEFNEVVLGAKELRVDRDLYPTTRSNYLLIIAVDNRNRTKYYTSIPLDEKNVRAYNAPQLREKTHYTNPIPGEGKNSTKFGFLNLPEAASKWMYKIGKESFGVIEAGITVDGTSYKIDQDILPVGSNDHLLLLAVDDQDRVIAYREFRLIGDNIRGGDAKKLTKDNYILGKGNKPSTTSFSNLVPLGLDNPNSIRWKIKLVNSTEDIPYMNSIIEGAEFYNVGGDITVTKDTDGEYGYILLLATDSGSRTKGYIYIKIDGDDVKEHAPVLDEIGIEEGDAIDTTKIVGLNDEKSYKYLIGDKSFDIPAAGDPLPRNVGNIPDDNNISIRIGEHLTIFEIDSEDRIVGYKSFEITSDDIKQGSAEFADMEILEGDIVNGGIAIKISLDGANWANVKEDKSIRDRFFSGFKADNQNSQWAKVVNSLIADGKGAIDITENILTVRLPQTLEYDIADEQKISLTIPSEAIGNAINPIVATGTITIKPTIGATVSGTVVSSIIRESDIKAGGATIVVDLKDGIWVTDVSSIVDGFISDGTQWDLIKAQIEKKDIVRNSGSKITITLPKVDVNFGTTKETIKLTIPEKLIEGAGENVVATPTFTLYPDVLQVKGKAIEDRITMEAPDNKVPRKNMDTWTIEVTGVNLKDEITDKDIIVTGLPRGLKSTVEKVEGQENQIAIKVSGTASSPINSTQEISVRIKGSAVTEPSSVDSDNIGLDIEPGKAMNLDYVGYELDYEGDGDELFLYLTGVDEDMEYSIDSTNGINGEWKKIMLGEDKDSFRIGKAEPTRIFVREKAQPKVFKEVVNLIYGEAPKGVGIGEVQYDKDESKCTVTLKGLEQATEYEYSIDGGKEWEDLGSDWQVSLDKNSDLRVRRKAIKGIEGQLSSLPTDKLNGIFLGSVILNPGEGRIENTHTTIEYSLNSSNGADGSWKPGRNNETLVDFIKGDRVWIRERSNPINKRDLGTIGQEDEPDISSVSYSIKDSKISNVNNSLEYRIASGNWISINGQQIEGVEFKPGKLEFRAKGTRDNLPSMPITKAEISQPANAPSLKTDDYHKKIFYLDGQEWHEIDSKDGKHEYKIGSTGEWRAGKYFNDDENKNENIVVYVREAATDEKLPSKETSINFTKNIELKNISIDVENRSILGTTTNMEYSINSTDGIDGTWEGCSNAKTAVDFVQGMDIWIREKSKPLNSLQIAQNIPKEPKPDLTDVYYNIATNKIANYTNNDLEYRIAGGRWYTIHRKSNVYEVEFVPGKFEFRKKATTYSLASEPVEKVVIKAKASKPVVQWDDVENKISKINSSPHSWDVFEYRIDGSHWITGELLDGEDLSGDRVVEIRIKATPTELSSQIANIEFSPNPQLEHVILSIHTNPAELNGTANDMEYIIYLTDNPPYGWIKCDENNTKLPPWVNASKELGTLDKIIIRAKDNNSNIHEYQVYPKKEE